MYACIHVHTHTDTHTHTRQRVKGSAKVTEARGPTELRHAHNVVHHVRKDCAQEAAVVVKLRPNTHNTVILIVAEDEYVLVRCFWMDAVR